MSQQKPKISIIAAISKNKVLGKNNKLLWHIPKDLKRFKKLTLGHTVIMGRKTFESIGQPLPKRRNIVVTRNKSYRIPKTTKIIVCHSFKKAVEVGQKNEKEELFVIGGGQIYSQAIGLADKLYLTVINKFFKGDVLFPNYSQFKKTTFKKTFSFNNYTYKFLELERIKK